MNYPQLAFTDAIKQQQEEWGSRTAYARMENFRYVDGLTDAEIEFIRERDSFYMASFGENEYPYIQHRGGPKGFIKVIDRDTIGIVDFSGNRQYISVGNITENPNVSLILVSYPLGARLKIYAKASIVALGEDDQLYEYLKPADYRFKPERMMIFKIQAYDWNCQQHIMPRYSESEVRELFTRQQQYISKLEQKIRELELKPPSGEQEKP
ncbi:pyridoxamine 5'-phosphate oxidase family protein [Chitinophaga agrisoli]|uniref:Pyridoxamine 5'-phosphate oxidase family protein n=1 Tax=Chitinophaga agrisoli TaxID=2607653 RepID=A0A5B2VVM6_9BACT|nr:pyridoxamine 5'-phosphate oxidase family protein [Chitinophaga agrisoli]KAA2242618.1 pyridoxamine 5'-phosphate oxidase family protein [Chitinophaga agrisoli]